MRLLTFFIFGLIGKQMAIENEDEFEFDDDVFDLNEDTMYKLHQIMAKVEAEHKPPSVTESSSRDHAHFVQETCHDFQKDSFEFHKENRHENKDTLMIKQQLNDTQIFFCCCFRIARFSTISRLG
jgi:hypothetical protein